MGVNVGEKIDAVRGRMSYADFSEQIKLKTGVSIHFSTLQKYVNGQRDPSRRNLQAIAKYAGKPISWFYTDSDDPDAPFDPESLPPQWKALWDEMMLIFRKPGSDLTNEQAAAILQVMQSFREQNERKERTEPRTVNGDSE